MHDPNAMPRRLVPRVLAGVAALLLATSASANIINPDFSAGFDGWTTTLDFVPVASPDTPEFSLPGGGLAKLQTSQTFFDVAVYQQFVLPGDAGILAFDFEWMITTPGDLVQISLRDIPTDTPFPLLLLAGLDPTALTGAGRLEIDVSAFAGREVELLAFVQDDDFGDDMLFFGNVAIEPQVTTVPAPATLLLAALTTLLVGVRGLRRRPRG